MTARTWVYAEMANDVALTALVGTSPNQRIFQSTSIDTAPKTFPFIMYRATSEVNNFRGDDGNQVNATGFMIFAHDIPGDYMQIDTMLGHLHRLFADTRDSGEGIVRSRWVDTSDDLRDDDMGTITKYVRIQVLTRL